MTDRFNRPLTTACLRPGAHHASPSSRNGCVRLNRWQELIAIAWPVLVALLLGYVVRAVLLAVARRAHARAADGMRTQIVEAIAVPAAVALPLLFLSIAVASTPLWLDWRRAIQHAFALLGMLCLVWLIVRVIGAVERVIVQRYPVDVENNLRARRVQTQARVLSRMTQVAVILVGLALALMTFPAIREIGATLLASAGIAGVVAGLAAKPVFGNLIAGLQIALTQPIRIDDVVIVEGQWGRVEEITSAFVVVRIWDERRMVVPLQWFIENPFQNWTRTSSQLLGDATLWLDYRTPMPEVRAELERICRTDPRWDGRVCVAQVTESDRTTIAVRLLVSARNSGDLFDLRCAVRERMIDYLNAQHPEALPRMRANVVRGSTRPDANEVRVHAAQRVSGSTAHRMGSPGAEDVDEADRAAGRPLPG
ncbi:mechanosensitive ion channel family protein [Lysobacter korlensis]|uniref:Mechanosensitive ion channel family protein n=1 Tax=Lysobacter korlensis TaxID=553636 RepID=A0ABV6RRU6_9GAMM